MTTLFFEDSGGRGWRRILAILALGWAVGFGAGLPSARAATRLKLGTLAPVGTTYHKSLMTLGEAWRKESAGEVNLNIFAGGKLGGEAEMVGLMKVNSLQAAMLTAVGLAEIEPGVTGLQNIPMIFRSFEEVDYVGSRLQPMLEARLEEKGFKVLFWSDAGWVRLFSSKPVTRPDDLRALKLFTWSGNPQQVEVYKSARFNAVPLETADIVPSLQTRLIDAVPVPPFFAMASQIDTRAPYMLDLNWGPLVGALVVRKETWDKLAPAVRTAMATSAAAAGVEIKAAGRKEMEDSVAAMTKRGLKVTSLSPEVAAEWKSTAESLYPKIRGPLVPEDIFDRTKQLIDEYRAAHPNAAGTASR